MLSKLTSSFRDPCGKVYSDGQKIIRSVNACYQKDFEQASSSGLFEKLIANKDIPNFKEVSAHVIDGAWKVLEVEKIPFISYPYEWSFPQLRAAAIFTLELQKKALECGMSLKDATAYNVQFIGNKPIFIDLLSFETRNEDEPWQAYRQFCMHFLAPLALQSFDYRLSRLSALWIDGIPLELAWSLLPFKANFYGGLQMHLHFHSMAEKKFEDGRKAAEHTKKAKLSTKQLIELIDSLKRTVENLPDPKGVGEWADYYNDTNYSDLARQHKEELIELAANRYSGDLALDLGANTGKYSAILAKKFKNVIAADIDNTAVANHFRDLNKNDTKNILPLVLDLANPSPAIGFSCCERMSWLERDKPKLICALALSHHLYFTCGVNFSEQAEFFNRSLKSGSHLVLEFVPREDSQVERMLAARDDIFDDYSFEDFKANFSKYFDELELFEIKDSLRKCFFFVKR